MYPSIVKINDLNILSCFTDVIKNSFRTVADQYGLTEKNSPTNPAFTTIDSLKKIESKAECFGLYLDSTPCGFFALEFNSESKTFYLERVCVLPEQRHNGLGKAILNFAENYCKNHNADKISIGIMNDNTILKKWYIENGYTEICIKQYPHIKFEVCFLENLLK